MLKYKYTALATALGLIGFLGLDECGQAFAAASASGGGQLEEITVTARRREENLQNVPVSVVAFTEKNLRTNMIRNLEDVGAQSPNVMIMPSSNAGNAAAAIFIRGIGQFDEIITTDPGVGVYIDGVYLARTSGALLNIGDFERVEVLRGPQGTLFGKNTIGGAVNITTHKPGNEPGGYAEATIGSYNRVDLKGAINMPIISNVLAARISAATSNADGFGHQANGVDTGNKNNQAIRGELRWTPNADLDVLLSGDKTRIRERMEPRSPAFINAGAPIAGLFNLLGSLYPQFFTGATDFGPQYLSSNPYFNYATGENTNNLDAWGTSLNVKWKINADLTLSSITAYRKQSSRSAIDGDTTPAIMIQFNEDIHQHQFSHEMQVKGTALDGKLDFVTGAIYFNEKANSISDSFQVPDLRFVIGDTSVHDVQSIKNDSIGVFAEGTFHLTNQFSATVGGRYTHEKKTWTQDLRSQFDNIPFFPPGTQEKSWNPVTPKVGLQFSPTADLMTYVSLSRGFRSGGYNGRANSAGDQSFNPEFVWTYEAGFKSQWLSNTLRLNGAVFYNDYRDLQILIVSATPSGGFDIFTKNAAKARTQGVELELLTTPLKGLELSGSLGYLDAKIKHSDYAAIASGNTLQLSPKWSYNLAAQYSYPISSFGKMSFRLNWVHRTKTYYDNTQTEAIADSFTSLNGRVALTSDKGWELSGFVTNITNRKNVVGGFDASPFGFDILQWGRPREFGATARYDF
jgi:iron complex outermembrane receptor protein